MRSKIFNLFFLLIVSLIIFNLTANIVRFWKKREVLVQEKQRLEELKNRYAELKLQLRYVESEEFIEKETRDKLGLAKPGEEVWILPPLHVNPPEEKAEDIPNWKRWWKLF